MLMGESFLTIYYPKHKTKDSGADFCSNVNVEIVRDSWRFHPESRSRLSLLIQSLYM